MDINVCRKCIGVKALNWKVHLCNDSRINDVVFIVGDMTKEYKFCTVFIAKCHVKKHSQNQIRVSGKSKEHEDFPFERIELADEICPYYLEHSMYDWSRER